MRRLSSTISMALAASAHWSWESSSARSCLLLLAFLIGFAPRITYGMVLLLHAISTLASYRQYVNPFDGNNLLFFAAWPMLAACLTLYWLRDLDTIGRVFPERATD